MRWLWHRFAGLRQIFREKVRDVLLNDPHAAAKFHPHLGDRSSYLVETATEVNPPQLPVPPKELWWGYANSEERYLKIGRKYVDNMSRILEQSGRPLASCNKILDFGAASGIMVRWLADIAQRGEVWGVDISGSHMIWCQQHLSPPFKFATTTTFPHLPFEDNYFDLVYAGSVFTHIADLAEAWLLELRRIVRPGGHLYLTVHDERTIEMYRQSPDFFLHQPLAEGDRELEFSRRNWDFFTLGRMAHGTQIFYRREYLRRHWGQYLKVVSITPEAYWAQSAVLLEK
jgi:SAM-dependent methyltransferase